MLAAAPPAPLAAPDVLEAREAAVLFGGTVPAFMAGARPCTAGLGAADAPRLPPAVDEDAAVALETPERGIGIAAALSERPAALAPDGPATYLGAMSAELPVRNSVTPGRCAGSHGVGTPVPPRAAFLHERRVFTYR